MRFSTFAATCLVTLLGMPAASEACSCIIPGPSCEETWQVDAVFVAQVLDIRAMPPGNPQSAPWLDMRRRVRLLVVEVFRGGVSKEIDVYTGEGGGDCGYEFRSGETYLVYGRRAANGPLTTNICSRTRPIDEAGDDLAYLRSALLRRDGLSTIFGNAIALEQDAEPGSPREPVANVHVVAESGTRRFEAWTAADGTYSMQVPPGKYRLTVDVTMPDMFVAGWPADVELRDPRACVEVATFVRSNGRLSARLVTHNGDPLTHLRVDLYRMPPPGAASWQRPLPEEHAVSNEDGRISLVHLPPGDYTLLVSSAGRRVYFPGVRQETEAAILTVGRGERVDLADFTIDATRMLTLRGTVRGIDGKPVSGADVHVSPADGTFRTSGAATSDAEGRFTITLLDGGRYRIGANYSPSPQFAWTSESRTVNVSSSTGPIDLIVYGSK
jgi:hypothetical protein